MAPNSSEAGKDSCRTEWLFAAILPVWLFGLIFPATITTDNRQLIQFVTLLWPAPICLLTGRSWFLMGGTLRGSRSVRLCVTVFLVVIAISSSMSVDPAISFGYAAVTAIGFILCAGIWSCLNWQMGRALVAYAYLGSALSAYLYLYGDTLQGRLNFGHPNYLAVICFGVLSCSLLAQNLMIRAAMVALNLSVIFETQSRSCLVASMITVLSYTLLSNKRSMKHRLGPITAIGIIMFAVCLGVIFRDQITERVSAALFLEDRDRGIGTGFTGRLEAWDEAYRMFLTNPIVGIGFRTHERFMTTLSSAHNGYFSTLAETGAAGICSALILIGVCTWRLLMMSQSGDSAAIVGFSFVSGFLFVAMFERYLINFGSSTAVLMWIFLLMPKWPRPGVRVNVSEVRSDLSKYAAHIAT
jgi:O-antigen ligase